MERSERKLLWSQAKLLSKTNRTYHTNHRYSLSEIESLIKEAPALLLPMSQNRGLVLDFSNYNNIEVLEVSMGNTEYHVEEEIHFSFNRRVPRLKRTFLYEKDGMQCRTKFEIYKSELLFIGALIHLQKIIEFTGYTPQIGKTLQEKISQYTETINRYNNDYTKVVGIENTDRLIVNYYSKIDRLWDEIVPIYLKCYRIISNYEDIEWTSWWATYPDQYYQSETDIIKSTADPNTNSLFDIMIKKGRGEATVHLSECNRLLTGKRENEIIFSIRKLSESKDIIPKANAFVERPKIKTDLRGNKYTVLHGKYYML